MGTWWAPPLQGYPAGENEVEEDSLGMSKCSPPPTVTATDPGLPSTAQTCPDTNFVPSPLLGPRHLRRGVIAPRCTVEGKRPREETITRWPTAERTQECLTPAHAFQDLGGSLSGWWRQPRRGPGLRGHQIPHLSPHPPFSGPWALCPGSGRKEVHRNLRPHQGCLLSSVGSSHSWTLCPFVQERPGPSRHSSHIR